MKLDRSKAKLLKISQDRDDSYVEGDPGERLIMVWEITRNLQGFGGNGDAER